MDVGRSIADLNMLIFKRISNRNKELGFDITPVHAVIIKAVKDCDGLCQKDIEKFVTCNKSTLSSILDTMEKNGLIVREGDINDSRKKIITLTKKSLEMSVVLEQDKDYLESILCSGLSLEELDNFHRIINKMIENLERDKNDKVI